MPADRPWRQTRLWFSGDAQPVGETTIGGPTQPTATTVIVAPPNRPTPPAWWAPYEATIFGLNLGASPDAGRAPGILFTSSDGDSIQVWRMTARFKASPVLAEFRWHPIRGGVTAITGPVDDPKRKDDVERARRGFKIILSIKEEQRGRRPGWRKGLSLEGRDLIDWYREAAAYYANESRTPGLRALAQRLQVRSHHTARRRWEEQTGLPWPPPAELLDEDDA